MNTDITWVSPVPLLSLLSQGSVSSVPPVSPGLAGTAVKPGRTGDPGLTGAQTGRDLVVLELAGKTDLEEEEAVKEGEQPG